MGDITALAANLASVGLESLLYGAFVPLFLASSFFFIYRAKAAPGGITTVFKNPLFVASVILFLSTSGHWVLTIIRSFSIFLDVGGASSAATLGDQFAPTEVAKVFLLDITLIVGDIILIYRLWIISRRKWWYILLPVLSFLGTFAASVSGIVFLLEAEESQDIFVAGIEKSATAFCVLIVVTNTLCAVLITWLIWRTHSAVNTSALGESSVVKVIIIIIESASLYVVWAILYLIVYTLQSNVQYTIWDCWCPVAGISFMMINVRAAMGTIYDTGRSPSSRVRGAVDARGFRLSLIKPTSGSAGSGGIKSRPDDWEQPSMLDMESPSRVKS